MRGNGIREYIHNTYNNRESDVFNSYLREYGNKKKAYDEFFTVFRDDLVGEYVWLPYYSVVDPAKKIYEGREAYVVDISDGLLECLVTSVDRKTCTSIRIKFDEELTELTPSLFFEFQKEYYRKYKKRGKLTDKQYSKIIKSKTLVKYCFLDFVKLAASHEC